eukprot:CAMPEP_0171084190 /NCGR_PEP_ID=MMETSP0766_2-20121228/18172_1 /TAXON_ID=439317 /ORGANISM="Gambierdiscus australes, Strain CAWD 149" /LENGTH=42 /DNA_ID= /DNA_START= /DNA_END= /DNA_ORIENTATION=
MAVFDCPPLNPAPAPGFASSASPSEVGNSALCSGNGGSSCSS